MGEISLDVVLKAVHMERLKVRNGFLMVYFFVREWDTNSEIRMIRIFVCAILIFLSVKLLFMYMPETHSTQLLLLVFRLVKHFVRFLSIS